MFGLIFVKLVKCHLFQHFILTQFFEFFDIQLFQKIRNNSVFLQVIVRDVTAVIRYEIWYAHHF
jgi:hypothetical protein